ncbi:hypothetical protein BKA69DRAFT_632015 [Paraphysoderma sedebokerense]|nr:hypothetical protein BKA69DRAFT_632015 [Paraphysoderma sedebokerense]
MFAKINIAFIALVLLCLQIQTTSAFFIPFGIGGCPNKCAKTNTKCVSTCNKGAFSSMNADIAGCTGKCMDQWTECTKACM